MEDEGIKRICERIYERICERICDSGGKRLIEAQARNKPILFVTHGVPRGELNGHAGRDDKECHLNTGSEYGKPTLTVIDFPLTSEGGVS